MSLENQWKSMEPPKTLLHTAIGDVLSEKFRCERTGVLHDFISFNLYDWVLALAETSDGKLVMVHQYRHGAHQVEWEFPGGCIEKKDIDPLEAAVRELREETGYTGGPGRILGSFCPNPAIQGNRCWIVLIPDAAKTCLPQLDDTEAVETVLISPENLMRKFSAGELDHGIMLNAILFYINEKHLSI